MTNQIKLRLLNFIFKIRKNRDTFPLISEAAMVRRAEIEYEISRMNPQITPSEAYFHSIERMERCYGDQWWIKFGNTIEDKIEADKIRWKLNSRYYSNNFCKYII